MINFQIPKLTINNYEIWLKKIETYLTAIGFNMFLNQDFNNNELSDKEKESQNEVFKILLSATDENDHEQIKESKTVKEVFKKLKEKYRSKEDIFYVFQDFTKIKFDKNEGIEKYFSQIQKIRNRSFLASGDNQTNLISDKVLFEKLIQDMPNYMEEIMKTIKFKCFGEKPLKYDDVVDTLINAYHDLKQPTIKKNEDQFVPKRKCHFCNKFGHVKKDCRFLNHY